MRNILMKYALAVCLLVGATSILQAQMIVEGTVNDSSGFPALSALVRAGESEAETDFDGYYELEVGSTDAIGGNVTLIVVGIDGSEATVVIPYQEGGRVTQNFDLGAIQLSEVVAIGYGTIRKSDVTGAVDLLTAEDFNQGPVISAQQMIQGKSAGVQVTSGGGGPGEGQNIRIRGIGSLSLNSEPLIVVDGVPISEGNVGGSRNILNSINPNDIESISVLKDASATAIYGSRGGNGVIIIETKKGRKGGLKYQLSSQVSFSEVIDYVDVLTGDQVRDFVNQFGTAAQIAQLGTANTNWQEQIFQNAIGWDNNLSVRGGLFGIPFRASVGYATNEGILKTDQLDRYTGSLSLTPKLFDDALSIEMNVKGSYIENQFADRGAIGQAVGFDPTQSIRMDDGRYWNWYRDNTNQLLSDVVNINPLALLEYRDDTSEVRRMIANSKFDYALPWVSGLNAVLNLGYDVTNSHGRVILPAEFPSHLAGWAGNFSNYGNARINKLLDAYLVYDKELWTDSKLTFTSGYSYQNFYGRNNSYEIRYQDNEEATSMDTWQSNLQSFFGRMIFDLNQKYILTATLRADASSKLNPNNRWGIFPSFAIGWNLHKEDMFNTIPWLSNLKLRAGYGKVGNVNGLGDYNFLVRYQGNIQGAYYPFGSEFYNTYRPEVYNPDLRWEISNTTNIALDYGLFNNRLNGYIDFYIRNSEDLIASTIIDPFTNFGNVVNYNFGNMKNRGVEFALNYDIIKSQEFKWNIGYNINVNDNEITKLNTPTMTGGISGGTGNNIQIQNEGFSANSFYVYQQLYDQDGKPVDNAVVDRNGDGQINDNDRYLYKDPFADITMGINTSFSYKNFDFSAVSRVSLGNYVYNNTASANSYRGRLFENGIIRNVHADFVNTGFIAMEEEVLMSDYYIEDASFFKLDNITLGYTLPSAWLNNVDMRVFGTVNNVLTVTDYSGLDPEVFGGIDNNFYPRPRIWSFGVNVNF
ncbi:MAG: SusC/RagA family TonB-linked outer membrane protein [Flavobacteriaceae bacterium]|nr:SusC/RagA family TonB-linked outer membrane protein [Flavobacteriaceae bacterium]